MEVKAIRDLLTQIDRKAEALHARSADLVEEISQANRELRDATALPWSIQVQTANPKLRRVRVVPVPDERGKIWKRFVGVGPECVSTYVSIDATCPDSCTFKGNGCYAQAGQKHRTVGKLDRAGRRFSALEVSEGEAAALGALWQGGVPQNGRRGGPDLRLHVAGDVSCRRGARALGDAVAALQARGLGTAWTYTHRWREIPRGAWGPILVLASCETVADAREAQRRGYAPALTVEAFGSSRAWRVAPGLRAIPCPFEARGQKPTCVECRLCLDRDLLRMGAAIVFAVHGSQAEAAKRRLRVVGG